MVISTMQDTSNDLTARQRELLDFIIQANHGEHRMPSYREMARALKVSAVGTVQDHIKVLVERGLLIKEGRFLKLGEKRSASMLSVPIVGEVAAGSLQDAYEVAMGTLPVSSRLLKSTGVPEDLFALRVKGESMIDAGIFQGDFVIVKRNHRVKSGEIVVASVDGEATVKEIILPKNPTDKVQLIPKNKDMKPILVSADEKFRVLGKVIAVHRYF